MKKNLSVITLSNKGYKSYTKNLIKSIEKNNIDINLKIYVMDNYSLNYFKKLNQNVELLDGINN